MSASASLIPELEDVIQHGSPERRAETLKRITNLFLDGASQLQRRSRRAVRRRARPADRRDRDQGARRAGAPLAPVGNAPVEVVRQLAHDDDIAVAGPVLDAIAAARRNRSGRHRPDQEPGASARHLRPRRTSAKRSPTCWSGAATARSCATSPTTSGAQLSEDGFSTLVDARGEATACWPRRSGCARTFRRICSAIFWCRRPQWCSSGCSRRPSPRRRPKSSACSTRFRRRSAPSARGARLRGGAAHGRGAASGGQARRGRARRIRQDRKFEETVAALARALRRADRGGRPPDGRRPARSGPDPLQGRRLRLADRARDHHGAAERQGHVEPGARRRLRQFRAAVAGDRAARGAVLAGAAEPTSG